MNTFFITMKKLFFAFTALSFSISLLTSCENETLSSTDLINEIETGINVNKLSTSDDENISFTTNLMAGQHHVAGALTVSSDETNLYATYQANCSEDTGGSWTLKATHLYVGNCDEIPLSRSGNPKIGKFPYKTEHGTGVSEFTYTIDRKSHV